MPTPRPLSLNFASGRGRVELLPRQGYATRYRPETGVIGFAYESQSGIHAFASSRETHYRTRPNSLAFVPAGCDVISRSDEGGEYLTVSGALPIVGEQRFNDRIDAGAIAAAQALRRLLLSGEPVEELVVEAAILTLGEAVENAFRGPPPDPGRWMTARRLMLVDQIIQEQLAEPLSVADLAGALGLSAGFFTRAFHGATGMPPHRYILEKRLAEARQMLRRRDATLAAIAADCGFASHAHLTMAMRRHLGVPPSALRG